jgi:hypothetical protein
VLRPSVCIFKVKNVLPFSLPAIGSQINEIVQNISEQFVHTFSPFIKTNNSSSAKEVAGHGRSTYSAPAEANTPEYNKQILSQTQRHSSKIDRLPYSSNVLFSKQKNRQLP